ncbi:hypothetical protein [Dyella acidiphila]|uniref:Secreted protein n=1 Tax=Dyella acidiphila TaxID=2775866 RepID=A0ABR9GFH8_9GAMM|nr:hypothetical protein [Dyella acidiphila]MBE1162778.1 hypothetical protein [Dyella acidiphila]
MKRTCHSLASVLFPLFAVLALCLAGPAFAGQGVACVKGPPEPKSPIIPKIRAIQTAKCAYGFDEMVSRITALATDKQSVDSVETVKEALGLPDITTGYDHSRIAAYALDMSGKGGWAVKLGVSEAFYPLDKGPARFVPGPHPRRLYKVTDAALEIDLRVFAFRPASAAGGQCVPISPLEDALKQAGWTKVRPRPSLGGGSTTATFQYGNKFVAINAECSKKVPQAIYLRQDPGKA